MNRRIGFVVAVAAALALGLVAAPRRYVVDGVSMGPGLLPGDIVATGWLPALDRWRRPARFDRWIVTLPDGSTGLKRVVGLPGETIELLEGDLVVEGRTVLKGPRLLAEIGSDLGPAGHGGAAWSAAPAVVLDDAAFAPGEVSRLLLPVRDGGYAAEVLVSDAAIRAGEVRARVTAGPLTVIWRLRAAGRYAVVAGRLDGQAVAAAWSVVASSGPGARERQCLPAAAPDSWDVVRPWPTATTRAGAARSPAFALEVTGSGDPPAVIERVGRWRDVQLRPAADGVAGWSLATDEVFMLGDFPSGSRDCRHFGALDRPALRQRVGGR
jgi:type IV secretory pathway protease TraF